ncbi:DegT/DnrJ/EryC1/StrS family aminotransferase [Paraburkholderia sp. J94]|uniref:DegT/DnrJ/EryC1/StrS family aminotransferase n=1 Tax=Paraburkholderia sp. J94 TaxID=2805441 RepID=UPI002AB0FB58|nr:DegT/DnrJ/EryC1/StrS family aminotransferase [Paraburkholderia sp. J94]
MKFPNWPCFAEQTLGDIQQPLLSGKVNYWTGSRGMEFEENFASWAGSEMAIACNSGTSAVHIALGALNIGPGDEVIVPSYTFIATSFAVLQAGAIPVFCDTTDDHTIDPSKIRSLISGRTKAIIVVHLYGVVCDMDPILDIARKFNLKVIEDAAQCLGGKYKGRAVGTIGDVGTFSFCQGKHFTTGGEGGMVITSDSDLGWECRAFRDHGFDVRRKFDLLALEEVSWHVHNRVGFNYRMTEIQSIIGINELKRFDGWNMVRRRKFAHIYDTMLAAIPEISKLPFDSGDRENAYWLYPIILNLENLDCIAEDILRDLKIAGAPAFKIQWPEAYGEKAFRELRGFGSVNFPFHSEEYTSPDSVNYRDVVCEVARSLLPRTISLYLHPSWNEEHIVFCAEKLIEVLRRHRV